MYLMTAVEKNAMCENEDYNAAVNIETVCLNKSKNVKNMRKAKFIHIVFVTVNSYIFTTQISFRQKCVN